MRNKASLFHAIDFTPSVLALLSGILIALQFVLPATAFASPTRATAPNPPADQAFALAEVSVVRLVVSYSSNTQVTVECTGLGVLVASWAATSPQDENTWVLTDGDLVNQRGATCAQRTSLLQIAALNRQWRQGIKDYYSGNFSKARQELTAAKTAAFTAPSLYLSSIAAKTSGTSGGQPGTPTSTGGVNIFGMQFSLLMILLLSVAGLGLLIILIVLVSLRFGAARPRLKRERDHFEAERAIAERRTLANPAMQHQQEAWRSLPQPRPPYTAMAPAPSVAHADTPGKEVIPPRAILPGVQELRPQNTRAEPVPPTTVSNTIPSHMQTETPHEQETHLSSKKEEIKRSEIIPEKPQERPEAGAKSEDRVGQQLGNYRLVRLLGRGGFAEVYLGEHVRLGTSAAIKVLYTRLANRSEVESFQKEAHTIASLEHPRSCASLISMSSMAPLSWS